MLPAVKNILYALLISKISRSRDSNSLRETEMTKNIFLFSILMCLMVFSCFTVVHSEERFIDNDDGTVTDTLTNLMWAASDNVGDISWHNAKIYCGNPPIAGYRYFDWRMPTIEELRTLYDKSVEAYETDCGLSVKVPPCIRLSCAWVWSSEHRAISAYAFSFRKGYQYSTLMMDTKHFRALPVRNLK